MTQAWKLINLIYLFINLKLAMQKRIREYNGDYFVGLLGNRMSF